MQATTASLVFKAAHAAAKVVKNFALIYSYRQRFAFALRAAWAEAKATKTESGEKLYVLRNSWELGGEHPEPMTFARMCELTELDWKGSAKLLREGTHGGYNVVFQDGNGAIAILAA